MQAKQRFAAVDLLRILAAVAVVAFHHLYYYPTHAGAFAREVQVGASYGYLGVQIFFMISGYVITQSAMGRTRRQFAFARFVRLWPAFVICLAITVVARQIAGPAPGAWVVLGNLTMMPRLFGVPYVDDVYWSLMYEIFFYAGVTMLLVGSGAFVLRLRVFTAVWLALALLGLAVELPKLHTLLALEFAPYFAVGISVFLVRNAGNANADCVLLAASLALAFVFAAIQAPGVGDAVFTTASSTDAGPFTNRIRPNAWLCGAIVLAGAGALYASTILKTGPRLSRAALALGGISYPLYLLHNSFGSVLIEAAPPGRILLSVVLAMSAVAAICYGVWRIEVPVRRHLMRAGMPSQLESHDGLPKRGMTAQPPG
jgi:peptidoglycan/LPS O-acetylase OafA/YrhL